MLFHLKSYMKKRLIFLLIICFIYLLPFANTQIISSLDPVPFSLENDNIRFDFLYNLNKIDLLYIVKKDSGHAFDVSGILWKIRLIDLSTAPLYTEITKSQTELNCQTSYYVLPDGSAQLLFMNWNNCAVNPTNKFNLTITVRLDQDKDYGDWRVFVNSDMTSYSVLYAKLFFGVLKDPDDYSLLSRGYIVKNPATTLNSGFDPLVDGGDINLPLRIESYYNSNNEGLYFWAKDASQHYRVRSLFGDGQRIFYGIGFYPEYIGTPGNDLAMDYDLSVGVFNGDWYDSAKLYRNWAINQPWANTKLIDRNDIPIYWKELNLGESRDCPYPNNCLNANLTFEIDSWIKVRDYYNATNLVVMYGAGATVPDFQPQPWASALTSELDSLGIKTFFYANPQSTGSPVYGPLIPYLCKNLYGQPYIDSGFARMDYTNLGYHSWFADKIENLAANGYDGMFFEVPIATPFCYNPPNPVGGINPWQGMINFMNEVKSQANIVITYEFFYEFFIPVSDVGFVNSGIGGDICTGLLSDCSSNYIFKPFFPVIYHDRIPMLSYGTFLFAGASIASNYQYLDHQLALDFSWGLSLFTKEAFLDSLGILLQEANEVTNPTYSSLVPIITNHTAYFKKIINARKYAKKYLVYGEMLRPFPTSINNVLITTTSHTNLFIIQRYVPDIPHSAWRSNDNKIGLLFANHKLIPANFVFSIPLQQYELPSTPHYGLYILNESGSHLVYEFNGNLNNYVVQMPPKSVRIYEIYQYVTPSTPTSCGATYPSCSGTCPSGQNCQQVGTSCQCIIQPPSSPTTQPTIQPSQPPTIVTTPPTVQQPPPGTIPTTQQQEIDRIKKKYSWKNYKLELAILLIILIACVIIIVKNLFKGGPKMTYGGK